MATSHSNDSFGIRQKITVGKTEWTVFNVAALAKKRPEVNKLPFSLRVLLENLLRHEDGRVVTKDHVEALLKWDAKKEPETEISFHPARVLMQDFTGVPAVVDLASMREAAKEMGADPNRINPLHPADLVIDHSVQIDQFGSTTSYDANVKLEFERNHERYVFLRWGQQAFKDFRAVPPGTGICHQVNLEYLAQAIFRGEGNVAYPDTLVGTDSHTTMVNGLGVVGWGVGGIEAEAALLGQPITMLIPQVVGFKLTGKLPEGATATDLVLTVTQMLRKHGVVSKFVEYYGPGISALSLPDRATLANMAPEYGATIGFFPIDEETLSYLRFTGRNEEHVQLVEKYARETGFFHDKNSTEPTFSSSLELDLATVVPSIAGPKRPQDRIPLTKSKAQFATDLPTMYPATTDADKAAVQAKLTATATVKQGVNSYELKNGAVVIAAITSCTNTSNPAVLLAAGLLAKKAVERGLQTQPWVKTSLAPGSQVVADYLKSANVLPYLEALGFHIAGYGCTTCIGNSGPLPTVVSDAIVKADLSVAAVLSGNRNFEGRINPNVRMNYLASPPLVVAYALAGTMNIDLGSEPIGLDRNGNGVFMKELWPTQEEVTSAIRTHVKAEQFRARYARVLEGDVNWQKLPTVKGAMFEWDKKSTYVRKPPFFENIPKDAPGAKDIKGARVLAILGDSVTTDHISPAGDISKKSPAAQYLMEHGVEPKDFNSYGARRGNHEVMMRGTFANIRLKNFLVPGVEGGVTIHLPTNEKMSIYDASMKYQKESTSLVILAGAEYGTGSSRDWAAKGTMLLGVKAVIAKSFERIHRSNLVGMGVLPLQFDAGTDATSLGLTGKETFEITGVADGLAPGKKLTVVAGEKKFGVTCRIDTPNELDYYKHGGILHYVLRQLAKA